MSEKCAFRKSVIKNCRGQVNATGVSDHTDSHTLKAARAKNSVRWTSKLRPFQSNVPVANVSSHFVFAFAVVVKVIAVSE